MRRLHPGPAARKVFEDPKRGGVLAGKALEHEAPFESEDPSRLRQRRAGILDVVEHRDHRGGIKAFVLERQSLGIRLDRLEPLGGGLRQHLGGAVDDNGFPPLALEGERVVAGAAADV